jgi:hypothetical protein
MEHFSINMVAVSSDIDGAVNCLEKLEIAIFISLIHCSACDMNCRPR